MTPSGEDKPTADPAERGVLTSLPSTRPQRHSARRAAARDAAAKRPTGTTRTKGTKHAARTSQPGPEQPRPAKPRPAKPRPAKLRTPQPDPPQPHSAKRRPPRKAPPEEPRIPRQGFETEEEIAPGSTVQPPSRPELAVAVADLLGELAQGGLTAGGRLLKDFLGRLPGV